MKDLVLAEMDALGSAPSLRRLIETLPADQPVVVRPHRAAWLPIGPSQDCDAALYMNVGHVHVKLDPADGEAFAARTGFHLSGVNGQTAYVRVTAAQADDPQWADELTAAVTRAFQRSITAPVPGRAEAFCLETFVALPVTGWCDDCEQVCA